MRIAVVGGGIVGAAVARELLRRVDAARVTLIEKEDALGQHQTGHNSGVVHAGLYYEPGSLKARLTRRGVELLRDFCERHAVAYVECGKVVVATSELELDRLGSIFGRAQANGVPEVSLVGREELLGLEPHCLGGVAAVHSPHTAIVDFPGVTRAMGAEVVQHGGKIELGRTVTGLRVGSREVLVRSRDELSPRPQHQGEHEDAFDLVLTCAGLQSDRLAALARDSAGEPLGSDGPRVVPFYGDYLRLRPQRADLVRGLIYPVPDPRYPFLGVHLTRHVDGEVALGPNAWLSPSREHYSNRPDLRDVWDTLGYAGFWRFAGANLGAARRQGRTALSRRAFVEEARALVPEITTRDVLPGGRGIRAQAMDPDGSLVDDFVIQPHGRLVQVRNAPSPGATASMAIAEHVVDEALGQLR